MKKEKSEVGKKILLNKVRNIKKKQAKKKNKK
jgi:hypothetical protein